MYLIHLCVIPGDHANPCADRRAIAFRSDQFDLDPVLLVAAVVPEERRNVTHVEDDHVDVAVVVIVAERGTATGIVLGNPRPHFFRNILELPIPPILINQPRILVGLADVMRIDLRIHVAVDLSDVLPAIVVVIHESATPGDVAIIDSNAG